MADERMDERLRCANIAAGWNTGSTIGRDISLAIMTEEPAGPARKIRQWLDERDWAADTELLSSASITIGDLRAVMNGPSSFAAGRDSERTRCAKVAHDYRVRTAVPLRERDGIVAAREIEATILGGV